MQKWQYESVGTDNEDEFVKKINEMGSEGWRVIMHKVSLHPWFHHALLEREIPLKSREEFPS